MRRPDSGSRKPLPDAPPAEDWFTVEDPEQARLLSDLESMRFFEPFLARQKSVSQAAEEVGCNVDTMLYRVRRFVEAGLLEVVRQERRAGRPIKYYRSAADAYFVPFATTPYADLEERLAAQMRPFQERIIRSSARLLRQSGRDGRRIYRKSNGDVWNDSASDAENPFSVGEPGMPTAYDFSIGLELADEEARELQLELHALFERYAYRERRKGKRYLWQLALLPEADE